jgi:hypothetical protein
MGNLQCLVAEVRRDFGPKRIWLTEYGYKTNPPDRSRGVSPALQARYVGEAARRAYIAGGVDLLIQFLIRDEAAVGRWASGLFTATDVVKPSFFAFMLPLVEVSRHGARTTLWGQIRPGFGAQPYLLERWTRNRWARVGDYSITSRRGYLTRTVHAGRGARFRLWAPLPGVASPVLTIH